MTPAEVRGVDLILHRIDQQAEDLRRLEERLNARLDEVLAEAKATNGRVNAHDAWIARHDGRTEAEDKAEEQDDERHDFWRDRIVSFGLGGFSAFVVAALIEALK